MQAHSTSFCSTDLFILILEKKKKNRFSAGKLQVVVMLLLISCSAIYLWGTGGWRTQVAFLPPGSLLQHDIHLQPWRQGETQS